MVSVKATRLFGSIGAAVLLALSLVMLSSCATQTESAVSEEQTQGWEYMSELNQSVSRLHEELDNFSEAVLSGQAVQIDNALKTLDEITSLEAPEAYSSVQDNYNEGCDLLSQALRDYTDLYRNIESATEEYPFDYSTYDATIENIQSLYDEGIAKLEEGDKLAAEIQ